MAPSSSESDAVRDHAVEVVVDGVAEALAARAGAGGAVEAEQAGLGLGELEVAALAGELLAEAQAPRRLGAGLLEERLAGLAVADLQAVHQALAQLRRP